MSNIVQVVDPRVTNVPGGAFQFDLDTGRALPINGVMPEIPPDLFQSIMNQKGAASTPVINTPQTPTPSVVNGHDPEIVTKILQGIPGHEKWSVVGEPQTDAKTGDLTWNITSPTGKADTFTVSASGNILTPPQNDPETAKKDAATITGPDAAGKYWAIPNGDESHPVEIPGMKGKVAKNFTISGPDANGNYFAINNEDPKETVQIPGLKGKSSTEPTPYEKEELTLRERAQTATERNEQAANNARNVENDIRKQLADETITEDKRKNLLAQAKQALDEATLAQNVKRDADEAWARHQAAGNASRQTDIEQQRVNQEKESQSNTSAIGAANALEANRHDLASEATQKGQVGAGMLNDRATHATGLLNNWVNAATGNKNFGLGGAIPAGLGAGLMSDAQGFATQAMGGEDVMKAAQDMVHAANPSLQGTPEGGQWTAVLAQMLEKKKQELQGGTQNPANAVTAPAGPTNPNTTTASPAAAASNQQHLNPSDPDNPNRVDPSSPDYLGKLIAATIGHIGGFKVGPQPDRSQDNPLPQFGGTQ